MTTLLASRAFRLVYLPEQRLSPQYFKIHAKQRHYFISEVDEAGAAYVLEKSKTSNMALQLRSEEWKQRHLYNQVPDGFHLAIVQAIEPIAKYWREYYAE